MRLVIVLTAACVLTACATAGKINRLSLGMSKPEVMAVMGTPTSTSAQKNVEYLTYQLSETDDMAFAGVTRPYWVRLIDGKVEMFGRAGDFGSAERPVTRIEVKQSVQPEN